MASFDPASIVVPCAHFIGGRAVEGGAQEAMDVRLPSDGQIYAALALVLAAHPSYGLSAGVHSADLNR